MSQTKRIRAFRVAIAWYGLPYYAACLIRRGIEALPDEVTVIGTRPDVPIRGMEEVLEQPILWVDGKKRYSWKSLGIEVPDVMFQTGWSVTAFNSLSKEVKHYGGKVAAFVDNVPRPGLRQLVGAGVYRLVLDRYFDAIMVPGLRGRSLGKKFGISSDKVFIGMYGADPIVFGPPPASSKRGKEFLFVGQFIKRKGVDLLVRAFGKVHDFHSDYQLRLVGAGSLRPTLSGPGIIIEDFLQPVELSERYRRAAFFILPSREEHWGMVVHEAALCGNVLLLSDAVGSGPDLMDTENGFFFQANNVEAIREAMEKAIALGQSSYDRMSLQSTIKAASFGPEVWANTLARILRFLSKPPQGAKVEL